MTEGPGRMPKRNFHSERSNETHAASTTESRCTALTRSRTVIRQALLIGHVLMGIAIRPGSGGAVSAQATAPPEREAALTMLDFGAKGPSLTLWSRLSLDVRHSREDLAGPGRSPRHRHRRASLPDRQIVAPTAMDRRTTLTPAIRSSQRCRKRIESVRMGQGRGQSR